MTAAILPDFSAYLTGDRLAHEDAMWAETRYYERNAANILAAARLFNFGDSFQLIELGCGSGWLPSALPSAIAYVGVDSNPGVLALARGRNYPERRFIECDIRAFACPPADLVCSFAVLKHFGLGEWEDIFRRMLRLGACGLFNILTSDGEPFDDGTEFHRSRVTEATVARVVAEEGRVIARRETIDAVEGGAECLFYVGKAV